MEKSIQFLFKDIAKWLHPSDFYQLLLQLSLEAEENDLITVPYYELSPAIQRRKKFRDQLDKLKRVLQTCRYWGLEMKDWPDDLCHVLWGKEYRTKMEEIVHQLYPTLYIGNNLEKIMIDGNLRALQYAHQHGCHWDEDTCSHAAKRGHLECLQYAHEHGCPWNEDICYIAARYGQLECLQYVHEHGCPWAQWTCIYAASNGHLKCLQYAYEHGCPWTETTCSYAAEHGHLKCLQYAHEHGCHWNQWTCYFAAKYGHLECLQYAHDHGCPINWYDCLRLARQNKKENILHYLLEHQSNKNSV